jgi:cytoskeletal protein CcmA (bactofilin family)
MPFPRRDGECAENRIANLGGLCDSAVIPRNRAGRSTILGHSGDLMPSRLRVAVRISLAALTLTLALPPAAIAQQANQDRVEFGRNITIDAGQSAGDISCFNCSVYVRGTVNGDIAVFGGRVVVEGKVKSDIAVFWGTVRLEDGAQAGGDVAVFGGAIRRAPSATIHGDVVSFGRGWVLLPVLVLVALVWLIVALVVWLVTRNRRAPAPGQTVRQT